MAKRLR